MLVIETLFHHGAWECFFADLYFQWRAEFGMCCVNESHAHALASGDGVVSRGHLAHLDTVA